MTSGSRQFLHELPCLCAGLLKMGMKAGTMPSLLMLYDVQFWTDVYAAVQAVNQSLPPAAALALAAAFLSFAAFVTSAVYLHK